MATTTEAIWNFLIAKGLTPQQAAGIMGNLQVESGFSPTSTNTAEGAHGIANWEGGRWPALQTFAAQSGGSANDLGTQLNFMWHELTTSYTGALSAIRATNDPAQVAAIFDSQYEVSSGAARQTRISYAQNIFSSFKTGGVNGVANYSGGGGPVADSAGSTAGGGPTPTAADFEAALPSLSGLLTAIPELKKILQQAVSGGWDTAKFQQAVEASAWYRTNNAATRSLLSLQYSDPAEYKTKISQAQATVSNLAHQLGVSLNGQQLATLAQQFIVNGWDTQSLGYNIGKDFNAKDTGALQGQIATAYSQLHQMYADYGVPVTEQALRSAALSVAQGLNTVDATKESVMKSAESMYPSIAGQLQAGQTVRQVADPYIQTMSNLLEIDPNNVGITDPTIKKALQGSTTVGSNGQSSSATTTPLWQFENQIRSDPRWQYTDNAKQSMSTLALQLGRDWGFAS